MGSMGAVRGFMLGRRGWAVATTVVLLLLATSSISVQGRHPLVDVEDVGAPSIGPIPILTLSLFPTQLQAEVTKDQLGAVTFGGTATVDQMRLMTSTITLQAVVNSGWPVVVTPQTFEMTGSGEEQFTVTVIVPPATSSLLSGNVYVTGSCKAPGLSPVVASCSGVVTVASYYRIAVWSPRPVITLKAGEEGQVELFISNRGNERLQVTITPMSKDEDVSVVVGEVPPVDSDEILSMNVTIKAESGLRAGHYLIVLRVQPVIEGDLVVYEDFNITLYVPSFAARLGTSSIAAIVVVIVLAVATVVLFRKGKLEKVRVILRRKKAPS